MKLLYFTTEDINSGLFESQVLENLYGLLDRNPSFDITLFVINKPSHYFKHRSRLKDLMTRLKIVYLPLSPPMRFYTSSVFLNKLYVGYISLIFKLCINPEEFDVVHCRHYLPSLVCQNLGIRNIHFDIRSLSLFEYMQAGKIKPNSKEYYYWLEQERDLVLHASGISVVSASMISYLKQYTNKYISYCPIIVNPNKVYYCPNYRQSLREEWGFHDGTVYVYSGSFGLYGLNKEYLAKLIKLITRSDHNAKFLFLLSNRKQELNEFIINYGLQGILSRYESPSPSELYKYLSAGDVGIHALPPQLDAFSRLGTKIVEYWCCGMPTLINNHVGEAADISNKYQFGYVLDLDNDLSFDIEIMNFSKFDRDYIRRESLVLFGKASVLNEYQNSYRKIIAEYREEK